VDKNGNLCPKADNLLFYEVQGDAELAAACNGDATDQTSFRSSYMRTFNGEMVITLRAKETSGEASLRLYGGNLLPATVTLHID